MSMTASFIVRASDVYASPTVVPAGFMVKKCGGTDMFRFPEIGEKYLSPEGKVCTYEKGDVKPRGPRFILEAAPLPKPRYGYVLEITSETPLLDKHVKLVAGGFGLVVEGRIISTRLFPALPF